MKIVEQSHELLHFSFEAVSLKYQEAGLKRGI